MVKVESGDVTLYLDGYLKSNLDIIKPKVVEDDFDCIFCIDGYEGFGKDF